MPSPLLRVIREANPSPARSRQSQTCQVVVLCPERGPHVVTLNWNSPGWALGESWQNIEFDRNAFEYLSVLDPVGQYRAAALLARDPGDPKDFPEHFLESNDLVDIGGRVFVLGVYFLGAQGRHPDALPLFNGLRPNPMVLNGVGRGPILVAAARFQRLQFVFCDLPESVIEDPTLFDELRPWLGILSSLYTTTMQARSSRGRKDIPCGNATPVVMYPLR